MSCGNQGENGLGAKKSKLSKVMREQVGDMNTQGTKKCGHLERMLRRMRGAMIVAAVAGAPMTSAYAQDDAEPAVADEQAPDTTDAADAAVAEDAVSGDAANPVAPTGDASAQPATEEEGAGEAVAPTMQVGATDEERAALQMYQKAFSQYKQESDDYQKTVDSLVESKYRQKVSEVRSTYNRQIDELTAVERSKRNDAIVAFESFIAKHPTNEKYTPDALFRLAELYFEKSNDDFLLADDEYQAQMALYERGKIPDQPPLPTRNYDNTISTFRKLINNWPEYRLLDGAYYLLAYCELQQGNDEEAKDLFLALIDKRPDSEFVPEAWIRIGEYYFDLADLENAREAYAKSMEYSNSRFYDKALYKLAWTYYRQDNFPDAIARFKQLVEYSDELERKTGRSGSVLRSEAVQYVAISLAENDWDSDGIVDDNFGLARTKVYLPGEKDYEREMLAQLVDYLFDNAFYRESADVARYTLAQYKEDPENPKLHEQLVLALFRDEDMDSAFEERRQMGAFYGPDSAWYAAQQKAGNVDAMRYATDLARDNLIQSAQWFHEQAQKERDEAIVNQDAEMLARAQNKYGLAAKTYAEFLKKHPNDKDSFKWNFFYAETLFYSEQYLPAYEQYRAVREMDLRSKEFYEIQETSAFNAVKALELVIKERIAEGEIPGKVMPEVASADAEAAAPVEEGGAIKAEPLPELVRKYVTEMDRYVVLKLKNAQDPLLDSKFAFQAAKIFYDFNDFPEARRRFDWIIKTYPDKDVGAYAASLTLETYRVEKDYDKLAEKASEFASLLKGDQVETIKAEIEEYELASLFKAAEKAYAEERYEDAVKGYLELMSRDEEQKYTTLALINTAVAYEKLDKPGEAAKVYERIYTEFPSDVYAPYALYRVAVTSERFFEFEKASQNYLAFYDRFADKETPSELDALQFDFAEKGGQALLNGAILLENMQQYKKASDRYVEYARRYSDRPDADDAYWQAIKSWEKAGQTRDMLKGYERYIDQYGSTENSGKVFEALGELYGYYEDKGRDRDAKKWYQRTIEEYGRYGIQPGSPEAYYAAEAEFKLLEYEFAAWDSIKIKGSQKQQGKLLQDRIKGQQELNQKYERIYAYRNLEWTLAASFRVGSMYQRFAQALYDTPVPFAEGSEEWDIYRTQLDDIAVPLEDEAVKNYEKVIAKAREEKVVNEWTKRALEELNKYRPADFPLYKEERQGIQDEMSTGLPYLDGDVYNEVLGTGGEKKEESK